jgi:hypothetical protein
MCTAFGSDRHEPQAVLKRMTPTTSEPSQADKFKEAARELEADEDEGRWEERLRKIAKPKTAPPDPQS